MYTCVRALLRRHGGNQRLFESTVNVTPVRELAADYETCVLVLLLSGTTNEIALDLADIPETVLTLGPTITVDQWLVTNGNKTLPTTDTVPKPTAGVVKSRDIFVAEYHVELMHPTEGEGTQVPDYELTDLKVTREDVDYQELYEHGLFTVNGLCHIADYSSKHLRIKGGGRSVQYANRNMIGMHSFLSVGKMTFLPITDEMIVPKKLADGSNAPLKSGFVLNLPGVDLSNKAVMISFAGILHFGNERYRPIGDSTVMVDWYQIPLMEIFYNARPYIDMSSFEELLGRPSGHGDALDLIMANRDDSIRAFLKLQQTFVILVETDNFFVNKIPVEDTGLSGRYYHGDRPRYPLQLENGFLPEYMTYNDWGEYVIAVDNNLINRYTHNTRPYAAEDNYVTGARQSSFPTYFGSAYLLEMGRDYLS